MRLCDKYRPRTTLGVMLSQVELGAVRTWLKSGTGGLARAVAPTGSGLTTAIQLLTAELGMQTVWISASTTRAKTLLSDAVSGCVAVTGQPKVVVMDDFDALLTDTQLITELTALSKQGVALKTPVLCLGHTGRSSKSDEVSKKWVHFKFKKPSLRAVMDRVATIARAEDIPCDPGALEHLCTSARGDIRAALNTLDLIRGDGTQLHTDEAVPDAALDGLDVVKALLCRPTSLDQALRMTSMDPSVIPMGMFENYLPVAADVDPCAEVADFFSMADVTDKHMYGTQAWDMADLYAVQSVAGPALALHRGGPTCVPDVDKFDPSKFGLVWSKLYNQCAKAKNVRALCRSRGESKLAQLDACDLAYVRDLIGRLVARGDVDGLGNACHGLNDCDLLTLMRLWKTDYKTSTHARAKKMLSEYRQRTARPGPRAVEDAAFRPI